MGTFSAHTEVIKQHKAAQSLERVIIVSRNSSLERKAGSSAVLSHRCIVTQFIPHKGLLEGQERGKFTAEIATRALILFGSNYSSSRYHLFAHGAQNFSQSHLLFLSLMSRGSADFQHKAALNGINPKSRAAVHGAELPGVNMQSVCQPCNEPTSPWCHPEAPTALSPCTGSSLTSFDVIGPQGHFTPQ